MRKCRSTITITSTACDRNLLAAARSAASAPSTELGTHPSTSRKAPTGIIKCRKADAAIQDNQTVFSTYRIDRQLSTGEFIPPTIEKHIFRGLRNC